MCGRSCYSVVCHLAVLTQKTAELGYLCAEGIVSFALLATIKRKPKGF
jgi:hypothetical protein